MNTDPGEFELEVSVPMRVRYHRDEEGRWEVTAMAPLAPELAAVNVPFAALVPAEQRTVLRAVAEEAALRASEEALERALAAMAWREGTW